MLKKKIILISALVLGFLLINGKIGLAVEKQTTTATINGVTANLEYVLDSNGNATKLVCTNASELMGSVTIPSNVDGKNVISIGEEAFKSATNITEITIPDSVTEIEMKAFRNCTGLTKINFGTGLTKIGINTFKGCTGLTSIEFPKSLIDSIENYDGTGPFDGCTNITNVTFEDGATVIPEGICAGMTGITEITLPASVTKIEMYAFNNCPNLKKITILDGVTDIEVFDDDVIFKNRSEDLTIYCYESSKIDEYAKKHNIKTVYLTRETTTEKEEEKVEEKKEETPTKESDKKEDNTVTPKKTMPKTGESIVMIAVIGIILVSFAVGYYKYKKM